MRRFLPLSLAFGMCLNLIAAPSTNPMVRPHVLLVVCDQLRADCIGSYGNRQVKTPNLDLLAADGIRFNNSFCAFPVCTPSRYSILTGLSAHVHRGWSNHSTLPPGTITFPEVLRQNGFHTRAVGKMHFTPTYADYGLSELILAEQNGPGRWDDDYHRYLRSLGLIDANDLEDQENEFRVHARGDYKRDFGALVSNLDERYYSTTWIGDRAVETLDQWDAATASLLMVGFIKPHHPFDPPQSWAKMYDPQQMTILPGWTSQVLPQDLWQGRGYFDNEELNQETLRKCMACYYATISEIDFQVGRMVSALKNKGLYDSTLIIVTADHGEYLGFHHLLLKGNHMYDPLAKVPLIIHPPGKRSTGETVDALVVNTDLAPTILRAASLPIPSAMKGDDLLAPSKGHEIIFCEDGNGYIMARTMTQKLLWRRAPEKRLFFDLTTDPLELTNRVSDPEFQEQVARLSRAAQEWRPRPVEAAYLDEDAPRISQPNVPSRDQRHDQMQWFRQQMQKWQSQGAPEHEAPRQKD